MFAVLTEALKQLPESFQLYELSRLQVPDLENTEIKPIVALFKGIVFIEKKWFYLSDEALSQGIYYLENDNLKIEYKNSAKFFKEVKLDSEKAEILQLHALSCLLRAYARYKTGEEEMKQKLVEDSEKFLSDAEKLGIDNELTWIAGSYVYINKGENEKAIACLEKLEKSEMLGSKEKEGIADIKKYMNDRENDKALNIFFDKIFIGQLVLKYFFDYLSELDWYFAMNQSEAGKTLNGVPNLIDSEYKKAEKTVGVDNFKKKGSDLWKKVF